MIESIILKYLLALGLPGVNLALIIKMFFHFNNRVDHIESKIDRINGFLRNGEK